MYLNNNNFRFNFIGGINIIKHAIFMKIRIVHTLHCTALHFMHCTLIGYKVSVLIHLECPTDTVRVRD